MSTDDIREKIARSISNYTHIHGLHYQTCNDVVAALGAVEYAVRSGVAPSVERTPRNALIREMHEIAATVIGLNEFDVAGLLECCPHEFYRKVVWPLEDRKPDD